MPVLVYKTCYMLKPRLAELLSRKLSGEASEQEINELNKHLGMHQDDQYLTEILLTYWNSPLQQDSLKTAFNTSDVHFAHILELAEHGRTEDIPALNNPVPVKNNVFRMIRRIAAAAVLIGLIASGVWLMSSNNSAKDGITNIHKNEVFARSGTKSKLQLPDGTTVILNSDSRLYYNKNFNDNLREVSLEGEAYFDVVKNTDRPFIVHTSGIDIRVVGTAFNVKAYAQDPTIEATLLRGIIEVVRKNDPSTPKIILKPNEKLIYNKVDPKEKVQEDGKTENAVQRKESPEENISITTLPLNKPDSLKKEISWTFNRLVFDGDNFKELAEKMERWYAVKIVFKDEELQQEHLKGIFEKESIEEALRALQLTVKFRYKIRQDVIELRR